MQGFSSPSEVRGILLPLKSAYPGTFGAKLGDLGLFLFLCFAFVF